MSIVAFASQKGGVGKSTLARALAVEAARAGLASRLADLDVNQGTLGEWQRDRLAAGLSPSPPVQLHPSLGDALSYAGQVDLLVVDGPARADRDTLVLAQKSDLVVLPSGASLDDLRPAVRVANSLRRAGIPPQRLLFVLTRISTEAEARAAQDFIREAEYRVAIGYLPERPSYRAAQNMGRAVTEAPHAGLRAIAERLVQEIIDAVPDGGGV